jgi:hypothetical protein
VVKAPDTLKGDLTRLPAAPCKQSKDPCLNPFDQ